MYRATILSVVACCVLTSMAQVSIGHRVGVMWSKWSVTGSEPDRVENWNNDQTFLPGHTVEIPVEIHMFERVRLNTGIGFAQKGFQNDRGYKDRYRFNYIQFPLTLGLALPVSNFLIVPSIGSVAGLNVGGFHRSEGPVAHVFNSRSPIGKIGDEGYHYRAPDREMALLGRLNVSYRWDHSSLNLDLSYQHGISDVMFDQVFTDLNGNEIPSPHRYEARQRSFGIQLGYQLALGRGRMAPMPVVLPTDGLGQVIPMEHLSPKLMLGTRFGTTSSTMDFTANLAEEQARVVDGAESLVGVNVGVLALFRLSHRWSLQTEFAYVQKGWRCQWYPRPTVQNDLLRMNYVEFAPLVHFTIGKGRIRPFVLSGPVAGRGVGGIQYYRPWYPLYGPHYEVSSVTFGEHSNAGEYEAWDFSGQFGAGVGCTVGHSVVTLDVRYQHSFTDFVNDKNTALYSDQVEAFHRNWMVNFGYMIPWTR